MPKPPKMHAYDSLSTTGGRQAKTECGRYEGFKTEDLSLVTCRNCLDDLELDALALRIMGERGNS